MAELLRAPRPANALPLYDLKSTLVSKRFGILKELAPVEADPSEPAPPVVFHASLANHRYLPKEHADLFSCSGKGFTARRAMEGAMGEAVERYSACFWSDDEVRHARRRDLPGRSIDAQDLVLFDASQYGPAFPYARYDEQAPIDWTLAHSLSRNEPVWVPASSVFMMFPQGEHKPLFSTTSNGLAAGPTLADAIVNAALEVIERDAIMIGWLNRLCLDRWDASTHPDAPTRHLVEAYRRRGVEISLFRMPSDLEDLPVFLAIAVDRAAAAGPAAVVGLGCDFDSARSSARAIAEIAQVRPSLKRKLRQAPTQARLAELLGDPHRVTTLHDHDLLYAHPHSLSRLEFLLARPVDRSWESKEPSPGGLPRLIDIISQAGHDLIYHDLTTPDMRQLSLFAARTIIPSFQPIDFGWIERRLGGPRLFELPMKLGLRSRRVAVSELNSDPHPIA